MDIIRSLECLYPPFKEQVLVLLDLAKKEHLKVKPFETLRTIERQQQLYGNNASRLKTSYHQYGLAVDIYACDDKGFLGGKDLDNWQGWDILGTLGKSLGMTWGGDWKAFNDRVHFENLFGVKPGNINTVYYSSGIGKVWEYIDSERTKNV